MQLRPTGARLLRHASVHKEIHFFVFFRRAFRRAREARGVTGQKCPGAVLSGISDLDGEGPRATFGLPEKKKEHLAPQAAAAATAKAAKPMRNAPPNPRLVGV